MTDTHEAKYQEMQKYVPFIRGLIEKLKVSNDHQSDNPRKAQLQKMEMLHDLLTNKHKKIKIETLTKCEGILIKLQAKIGKQTNILQNKDSISTHKHTEFNEAEDTSGPASPPPEVMPDDDIDQPVVIPTERRCSPILEKEIADASKQNEKEITISQHSAGDDFQTVRNKVFNLDSKTSGLKFVTDKQTPSKDKKTLLQQKRHHDAGKSIAQEHNANKHSNLLRKEKDVDSNKPFASVQKLQTVKVVITEPLPEHIKMQHFPFSSKYISKSSPVCHNNLKPLVQTSQRNLDNNGAYSPEELWEQFNESHNKRPDKKTAPVFSRLGTKVSENSSTTSSASKTPGRYTPIPDVLKSPPLSVSDINNLLIESGSDKILNDISEIGSRRATKNIDNEKGSPSNSLEFVRKKLAKTVRMNSPHSEIPKLQTDKNKDVCNVSLLAHERIALKYNPHPRQERLQSASSTDGSECSIQSKTNDPRTILKLQVGSAPHSSAQGAASNVNVLPAINLSDPRLKKQNILSTAPERKSLPSTSPKFTSTPNMGFPNQNNISYGPRKDPRISRIPNNTIASIQTTPTRKISTSQQHYSSEENRDSDEEKTWSAMIVDPRLAKKDQYKVERSGEARGTPKFSRNHSDNRNISLMDSAADKVSSMPSEKETSISKLCTQQVQHKMYSSNKQNIQQDYTTPINNFLPSSTFVVPNPPKSDSEEDWDADVEVTNIKQIPLKTDAKVLSTNKSPVVPINTSYNAQISPIAFVNSTHTPAALIPPIPVAQNPFVQPQYSIVGPTVHHIHRVQNPVGVTRFNSILNDKSERIKYLEAKKHKTSEPRTYKEFREAKERALAQEAAIKRAADEVEAKKRVNELKEFHKDKKISDNANDKKGKQIDASKKLEDDVKDKKSQCKDNRRPLLVESTLDKMYRTQNFNSSFPKPNTSFKIPKKKTEEKTKEESTQANETPAEKTRIESNDKLEDKIKTNQAETSADKLKSSNLEGNNSKCSNNDMKTIKTAVTLKQTEIITYDNSEEKIKSAQPSKGSATKQKPANTKTKENCNNQTIAEEISSNKQNGKENKEEIKEESQENLSENNIGKSDADESKINVRDPRRGSKATLVAIEDNKEKETLENKLNVFGDIVITSSENQLILKPQKNLDKFNRLAQESTPKPTRILQRRNTMVVFDSAPLVDKEKLRKANALLFEDVQEEEKRKRKQAEEDRLIARRKKNLEEMFKKTDDNCTVSTQNIITGKRRTRATINFNETVNAINVFKHKTMKDSSLGTITTTPTVTPAVKTTRSNFKIKIKNLATPDIVHLDESDDDESLETLAKIQNKIKSSVNYDKEIKDIKTKSSKETTSKDESKTEESETEIRTNTKLIKKVGSSNGKSSLNNALKEARMATADSNVKFKPVQNDEHQNCAVSSTSTDICTVEETTCISPSINTSFKKETDDNEPTSTAGKSNNPTPTPEPNEPVLNEIVDHILTPNANREHILGLLGQILSEEKLELIKSLIESSNKQNEDKDKQSIIGENSVGKMKMSEKNKDSNLKDDENEEDEEEDRKPLKSIKAGGGKKMLIPKKKRTELDRLNEDIRDMFICNGVLTATGRRMCTIMGKDVESSNIKKSIKESTPRSMIQQENANKRKEETLLKPPVQTRTLRRSTRSCKIIDDNEDNESILSHTTEELTDELNTTNSSSVTDATPQRKMPVLKPHTPIKMPEDVSSKIINTKETGSKRKSDRKYNLKTKKSKFNKDDSKEHSELEERESDTEMDDVESGAENNKKETIVIKNINIHWHNQSKYTTWCMICEKKILANLSSVHYKTHHRENYISRMAPVLLQQFKQGKLHQPLFGVKKAQKQPSWFYRCPFCLKYFNTTIPLWMEHFQNHTVEFRYECSKCHHCSNRKLTISRHIKKCEGATIINAPVKLSVPTVINAHVCHLCNFIQLKRDNLERHYIEQHHLEKKTVELLGYTIKLFDVENVECVSEKNAAEREMEAWKYVEKNEQVIDIDDEETSCTAPNNNSASIENASAFKSIEGECEKDLQQTTKLSGLDKNKESETEAHSLQTEKIAKVSNFENGQRQNDKLEEKNITETPSAGKETVKDDQSVKIEPDFNNTTKMQTKKESRKQDEKKATLEQNESIKNQNSAQKIKHLKDKSNFVKDLNRSQNFSFEVVDQELVAQDLQDELLALAAKAAEKEDENENAAKFDKSNIELQISASNDKGNTNETKNDVIMSNHEISEAVTETQATMSEIISSSIDMIYNRECGSVDNKRKSTDVEYSSEAKKVCPTASNVFMPTRDENNYSPTIQILAQSIINIEEHGNDSVKDKPITMAERLSQRFRDLQCDSTNSDKSNIICSTTSSSIKSSNENTFEKLMNDTLLESAKETDSATNNSSNQTSYESTITERTKENVFEKLFSETALELENDNEIDQVCQIFEQNDLPQTDPIAVISDDEDWEDIEITETAPTVSTTSAGGMQRSKNKGLFQKFGKFKGNNTKSKKHLAPMVFLPKKKTKEKPSLATTLSHSPNTTTTVATTKANEITTTNSLSSSNTHLSFKPVVNIMDGLFPDSPCNDPIDLVPELAPLEPLQDLNDISSILDSNLSAVNINAADNHTSIEDALDFISEQQANDKQKSNSLTFSLMPGQPKTTINNISHVGFSAQSGEENAFKFYCLLQNCSFLYSSDSMGLETHFMCEHSQIKWNGYCLMCQSQCFPNGSSEEHSISEEIRHMMEKHANKPSLDFNTDSTQHSTTSSYENDERPKIKLRRLTGDCLSRATPENVGSSNELVDSTSKTHTSVPLSMLGALLVADPKPPTKEMPPQPQMPLTEPLLLDNNMEVSAPLAITNVNSDFLITSVTSAAPQPNEIPLQISNVMSLNNKAIPTTIDSEQIQVPKISNVRTLVPKAGSLWKQQVENEHMELAEAAEESLEISRIMENAGRPSSNKQVSRTINDSPVLVAETVPLAQSKTGDFVVTQTVSAQYTEFSSTSLGFNISIAASATIDKTNPEPTPCSTSISSRQYKCMGTGCKFVSRVPVAMSDHLRFHERRNFSDKREYLICGFCYYCASDVEDYMKHANQFHIINKGSAALSATTSSETDTATSLTKKIQNILNSSNGSSSKSRYSPQNEATQVQDTQEIYLKKLRDTIDEIVGPTGLSDDKLYRCVVKNCHSQLTESTFLNHIMFHISTIGSNPNNYIYKCPHCTAQYHRPAGIKAHIKNHARNRFFCYLCDETSTNPGQILKHFSEKHWRTLNMYTKELLPPKVASDGSDSIIDSSYYVAYTQDLNAEEVRKFGEKLILEWQRKKSGSKTHFKSTEIDLLPLSAIFQRQVNCGECEYKTKVRTNMFRHLLMHKQNPSLGNKSGMSKVCSVDPVNPVPCLNSSERFFDKMTNLASSSLIPSSGGVSNTTKSSFKLPQSFVEESKRYTCGCQGCNYHTISEDLFRIHLSTLHSTAMTYICTFCKEEICKRGISIDRIMNHTRFHGTTIHRCEECNYVHHLRYVVERHINEKHATMKVNIVTHNRSIEDNVEGTTTTVLFAGKKYKESVEINQTPTTSNTTTRSTNCESPAQKPLATYINCTKGKRKWLCDVCGHRTSTVGQMQTHCQQQHAVKHQYKCAHCDFGSQQLSQILHHIDEKHSGKTREARYMYHKTANNGEEVADTRPLWQRNDPTRVRHIRGILMEDEEESEEYRKKLALSEDVDDDSNEGHHDDVDENDEDLNDKSYVSGYEFGCYHCSFKTQTFEDLKNKHYAQTHNCQLETAKPFWYRLHRRLCCPECRSFSGNYSELQRHLQNTHKKSRFYAADIKMAENDDTSQRILCGYCSFHCANAEHLYRHHLRAKHYPQDIRIDNNEQIMEILALGEAGVSYQCTLCADIFPNRVAIVQHACNFHTGEESFSFRELTNSLIYRCNSCCFTSTTEIELLRHAIDHYSRFRVCSFCKEPQSSFNVYMQHCYAEHKNDIQKFRIIYPLTEIKKFLLQTLIVFPSGLVLNKRNLLNTKYGKTDIIEELYEDIYKISQQPPIPRLSIARLVARKSIEAQQKHADCSPTSVQDDVLEAMQPHPKCISKRRCTVAFSPEDHHTNTNFFLKPKITIMEGKNPEHLANRRTTVDNNQQEQQQQEQEFNVPLKLNKISKRRRTVAVDRETLFSSNLTSSTSSLLTEIGSYGKRRKNSYTHSHTSSPNQLKISYPLNVDMEPFSFYGQISEPLDLSKIYTKVAIGGIKTPLTIDKFKLLFDIDCQLILTKCDEDNQLLAYSDYRHIRKACPASQKLRYN